MTLEFVNKHCLNCDYCIYQDNVAWGCGEIDEGGCCSECFETLKSCRLGHKPIPHTPKFKPGDRLESYPNPIRILAVVTGIDGYYVTQMEGGFGRFNEPYPQENVDLEEIDYGYELVEDNTPIALTFKEARLAKILWPDIDTNNITPDDYAMLKQKEEDLMNHFGIFDEEE